MINYRHLYYFWVVTKEGGFARAAERLDMAVQTISAQVRELEADATDRTRNEVVSGAIDVIGGLLGRKSTRSILGGVRRAGSSRRTSANAAERVESAKNRLEEHVDELEALAESLIESLEESQETWQTMAASIESFEVGLEKTDIAVEDLVLVWVPTD